MNFSINAFSPLGNGIRGDGHRNTALSNPFSSQQQYSSFLPMYQQQQQQQQQQYTQNSQAFNSSNNTWAPIGVLPQQSQVSKYTLTQQQYSPGLSASRSSSTGSSIITMRTPSFNSMASKDSMTTHDNDTEDAEGSLVAQLHRRDLEIQALKFEIKQLTELIQGGSKTGVYKVDPAVEAKFRELARGLKERDEEITKLQYHLEAALATGKTRTAGKGPDQGELAHRLVTRITALRDENKMLGVSTRTLNNSRCELIGTEHCVAGSQRPAGD
jgi:hypothetical protein